MTSGQVMVAGGIAVITACNFYTLQPGEYHYHYHYHHYYYYYYYYYSTTATTTVFFPNRYLSSSPSSSYHQPPPLLLLLLLPLPLLGVFIREFYVLGGDILVGAGVLVLSASVISNNQLFLNGEEE